MAVERANWQSMPCLEWRGRIHSHGYGVFSVGGKDVYVHRHTWEECFGPITNGLHVLHHCDNRKCHQPLHLFLGTNQDNIADRVAKGRTWTPTMNRTHCKRGHAFTEESTYRDKDGGRQCRICRQAHQRAASAKRTAARKAGKQ